MKLSIKIVILSLTLSIALIPQSFFGSDLSSLMHRFDKVFHILAFCVLTFIFSKRRSSLYALLAFGICIEVAQAFSTTHQASMGDVTADCFGIYLGISIKKSLSRFKDFKYDW